MSVVRPISRRAALKGLGTAIALPFLEAMEPTPAAVRTARPAPPVRMAFIYVPNGVWMPDWTPSEAGSHFKLPWLLEPLQPFQQELIVLSGLELDKAKPRGGGANGGHVRTQGCFLTCAIPERDRVQVGISVDQLAAQVLGRHTRFPSLELGSVPTLPTKDVCDHYPCAYVGNLAWKGPSTPVPFEFDPRRLFERLFSNRARGDATARRGQGELEGKSILDFVAEDAHQLRARLGNSDRHKIDEYLESVREVEKRVQGPKGTAALPAGPEGQAYRRDLRDLERRTAQFRPVSKGELLNKKKAASFSFQSHIELLGDLLVLAFRGDVTRVATFLFDREGSNRIYPLELGITEGHHHISHHGHKPERVQMIRRINRFHVSLLAYLLGKMKAVQEGERTLLDNSMIVYGCGMADGNQHYNEDLPILLAGKGGGTIQSGRHVRFHSVHAPASRKQPSPNLPLANLYLAMLHRMGVRLPRFGDSSGALSL